MVECNVVETSTEERLDVRKKRWAKYIDLFFSTNMPIHEIRKQLGLSENNSDWIYCRRRVKVEYGLDGLER